MSQRIPTILLYQQSIQNLSQIFPVIVYGVMGILSSFITTWNGLDEVSDQIRATYGDRADTFDFIIVGAGSAGSVLANRLSVDHTVLLLEAGGEPNPYTAIPGMAFQMLSHPEIDWLHKTVPQTNSCLALPNKQSGWSQGKGLGGTSNLNFLIYLRGHEKDYENWANITGDNQWTFNELLPFFKKAEDYRGEWDDPRYHGKGGLMTISVPPYRGMADIFVQAAEDMGYNKTDLNAPFKEGFSPIYMPLKNGMRGGSYKVFIESARLRRSLTIYKFSHVNKILFHGKDNEAYGVEYVRHGMNKIAYARNEIILSAGAIQSPKILLLSGIGPKNHLESKGIPVIVDLPGVGQNLQDHISTYLGPFLVNDTISTILERDVTLPSFIEYNLLGTGVMSSPGVQAAGFISSSIAKKTGEGDWPDIQFILVGSGVYKTMDVDFARAFHVDTNVMKKYLAHAKGRDSFQIIVSLARPQAKGFIELKDSNPNTPQIIDPKYLDNERDIKILVEGVKKAVELVETTKTMAKYDAHFTNESFPGCEHLEFRSDEYWECFIRHYSVTLHHIVGSCSMGPADSKDAVVDPELRVIGTKRLRIVDASVMPKVPIGNTHAPSVMMGEKGSDLVLNAWKNSGQNEINGRFKRGSSKIAEDMLQEMTQDFML